MTIEQRLRYVLIITVVFGLVSVVSVVHLSKGARFHQLNSLHLKYVNELSRQLINANQEPPKITQIIQILENIREQPKECLKLINGIDRIIMAVLKTDDAILLCQLDLKLVDSVLEKLRSNLQENPESYRLDEETRAYLENTSVTFHRYSTKFETYITRTVEFTIATALWIIIPFSLVCFILSYSFIHNVTQNAVRFRETAKALAESESKNRELAYYDHLTHLPNRNLLADRLNQTIQTSKRKNSTFALVFLDLDRFKHINDTLGHAAGDDLIKQAATRIKSSLRASDTLARVGGDEFVIILPELRSNIDASTISDKIISRVSKPFTLEDVDTHVTASLGIAIFPENGEDISTLMKRADIAMYQAKSNGKNQYCFYNNEINKAADKRLLLERDLRKGLDNDELELHYQPVINLQTGEISGVEALLRWQHGNEGMISPAEFIPIAEDTGLIVDIGYQVIEMACAQCSHWRKYNKSNVHVAVNISARQLREPKLIDHLEQCMTRYNLPKDALDIEITESAFYSDDDICLRTLHKLNEMKFRLLLDDFGTGYSSLSTLRSLPFDIIKIDRSFIMSHRGKNRKITESILDMAENFDMRVVAEGIEDGHIAQFLKQRGCQYGQGFLFQKPSPANEIDFNKNFSELFNAGEELRIISN